MGRNVTIQIWNRTGSTLAFGGEGLEHGHYQSDLTPPAEIADNNLGTFAVGNLKGQDIGPKGYVQYSVDGQGIVIDYNHPFSGAESSYRCYAEQPGVITAVMYPDHPEGDDQEVCWTIYAASGSR